MSNLLPCSLAAASIAISSCSRGHSIETDVRGPLSLNFTTVHYTGPPMSAEEDDIYLRKPDGSREMIFSGYGGKDIRFFAADNQTLLIAYCGGSVLEVKSSIVKPGADSKVIELINVQPITSRNLSVNGKKIC